MGEFYILCRVEVRVNPEFETKEKGPKALWSRSHELLLSLFELLKKDVFWCLKIEKLPE